MIKSFFLMLLLLISTIESNVFAATKQTKKPTTELSKNKKKLRKNFKTKKGGPSLSALTSDEVHAKYFVIPEEEDPLIEKVIKF